MPKSGKESIICLVQTDLVTIQLKVYLFDNKLYELKYTSQDQHLNDMDIYATELFTVGDKAMVAFKNMENKLISEK